jgi:ubiquitin-protein ligase
MTAFDERRDQDVQKLRYLQKQSHDRIRVTRVSGRPPSEVEVELHFRTVPSKQYPRAVQDVTRLAISLPARYPFVEPAVSVKTPILHPNIYTSGRICLGIKWIPSFGLDLLVRRIVQIVTYDPTILNEASPANGDALRWYQKARSADASAFPTDTFSLAPEAPPKTMRWNDGPTAAPTKTVVSCPKCQTKLSLPAGKSGRVKCPHCGNLFQVST